MMKYNIASNDGERTSVVVFSGNEMLTAINTHPQFAAICDLLEAGRPADVDEFNYLNQIRDLFDASVAIGNTFARISDRVSVNTGRVFFDGELVDNTLSKTIVAFHAAGEDFMPLVNFMEKVQQNPLEHSRQQLFDYMARHNFAICPDGDFIGYKSVSEDFFSASSGTAQVNGVVHNGRIPNRPGTIIEMPRSEVNHDPRHGCSTGLHVANWGYGSTFTSGPTLRLKVNPRDVVSVPNECEAQKMRVCRYQVLDVVTAEDRTLLYADALARVARNVDVRETPPLYLQTQRPQRKPARPIVWATDGKPLYFEQYRKSDWESMTHDELGWLAGEWKVTLPRGLKGAKIKVLRKEARRRLATWPEATN